MKHVEKIKALLRLARDQAASPAEAANALNRAMELIERHKIDIATLDLDEATENLVRENIGCGARVSLIKFLVADILRRFFNVRIVHVQRQTGWTFSRGRFETDIAVLGLESDVEIGVYVFNFLVGAHSRAQSAWAASEKKSRRKVTGAKKESYTRAWVSGVASNLRKPVPQPAALGDSKVAIVLAAKQKALDDFVKTTFPNTTTVERDRKRRVPTAEEAGWRDGRRTTINPAVKGGETLSLC
jgi:hypothetical protein